MEKSVTLYAPYLGYTRGVLTGKQDSFKHEIRFSSGLTAYFYEDEFTED